MYSAGFEPTILAIKRLQTYTLRLHAHVVISLNVISHRTQQWHNTKIAHLELTL